MKMFAWVRARNTAGKRPDPQPVTYEAPLVGSRMEIVPGSVTALLGNDCNLSLDDLAAKYPAPVITDRLKLGA